MKKVIAEVSQAEKVTALGITKVGKYTSGISVGMYSVV